MSATAQELLRLAEALARVKHASQKRKGTGEPYVNHLLRVEARVSGPRRKTIAWLHDLIEDQGVTPRELRHMGFPWDIIDDVVALSRPGQVAPALPKPSATHVFVKKGAGSGSEERPFIWEGRRETYFEFIDRTIREGSDDALYVKLADLSDNLHDDWTDASPSLRARYIKADIMVRAALHRRGADVPKAAVI
jgi:(p)ppGpp synthase/HD superfamily hydrolase